MATTISGSTGIDTQTVSVDDGGGTGPSVTIKGGGTSTDSPADNEQTLYLQTRNGTTGLSTGIGLWGTFESFPSDTTARRAADLRAGFNGGTWGNEYISFHVGVGTGTTSNDSAAMTTERLRITKTAMTANVDIEDTVGNVRTPKFTTVSSSTEITASGVYHVTASATITFGTAAGELEAGDIVVIYNDHSAGITIEDGDFTTFVKDGESTDNTSVTLAADSLATITVLSTTKAVISSGNLS